MNTNTSAKQRLALLHGKNILVSGISHESSYGIVEGIAAEGANLIIIDKSSSLLKEYAKSLSKGLKAKVITAKCDLSYDRDQVYNNLAQELYKKKIQHLDGAIILSSYPDEVFVSSSMTAKGQRTKAQSSFSSTTNLMSIPTPLWKDIMQINHDGVFILLKTILPFLMSAKNPSLIFSILDEEQSLRSKNPAFGVANFALKGLYKMLCQEMAVSHLTICSMNIDLNKQDKSPDNNYLKKVATAISQLLSQDNADGKKKFHFKELDLKSL